MVQIHRLRVGVRPAASRRQTWGILSTTSWMVPLTFPSCDMDLRSVSMAAWLERPSSDSPLTATSWSLILRRPSCKNTRLYCCCLGRADSFSSGVRGCDFISCFYHRLVPKLQTNYWFFTVWNIVQSARISCSLMEASWKLIYRKTLFFSNSSNSLD